MVNTGHTQKNGAVPNVIKNLFPALLGHNKYCQQRELSTFLMRYKQFVPMLTAGPRGQFPRWRRSRRRLSVCSVLMYPDLWLQGSVSFVQGLKKTLFLFGASSWWVWSRIKLKVSAAKFSSRGLTRIAKVARTFRGKCDDIRPKWQQSID
jgi:hypothetical protein